MLVVETRAVNHRFLDVRVHVGDELGAFAGTADEVVRRHLVRGRIELNASLQGPKVGRPALQREHARAAFGALCELRDELSPDEPVPLSLLAAVPGLFVVRTVGDPESVRQALSLATERACGELVAMRIREGGHLAAELERLALQALACLRAIESLAAGRSDDYLQALRARVARLLQGTDVALDPARLEHEIVLFADRSDVTEELARFASHCKQFRALLGPGDTPVGKRLEFLLQEMVREINTAGAKLASAQARGQVVELKQALERMREQVQNVL